MSTLIKQIHFHIVDALEAKMFWSNLSCHEKVAECITMTGNYLEKSTSDLPILASKKEEHCQAHRTNKFQAQWGVIDKRNEGRLDNFQNLDCNCCNPCKSAHLYNLLWPKGLHMPHSPTNLYRDDIVTVLKLNFSQYPSIHTNYIISHCTTL